MIRESLNPFRRDRPAALAAAARLVPATLLSVAFVPGSRAGEPYFASTARSVSTGQQLVTEAYRPEGLATGDFDKDGDLDVAMAHVGNFISPHMSVQMNQGDGSFGVPIVYPTLGETMDVVAADLDGDGDIDLAFAQSDQGITGNRVLVFRNQGDGTFGPQSSFVSGKGPTGITLLDADQDGDLDLATANWQWNESDLSVLYNDGSAGFSTRRDFPIPNTQPYKVESGDLDGDGFPELVATVRDGIPAIAVLFNDGAGGFAAPVLYSSGLGTITSVPGLGVADVDRDNDLDVLFAESLTGEVGLFRNDGTGSFGELEGVGSPGLLFGQGHDFAVGDLTGDGWPDVVAVSHSMQSGHLFVPGDGAGGFLAGTTYRTGEMARAVALGDTDQDGDLDVLVANSGSNTLTVHENEGGSFSMPVKVLAAGITMENAIGDLDNDGDGDIVTASSVVTTLHNQGDGTFVTTSFNPQLSILNHPKLRDLDNDGFLDLLLLKNTTVGGPPYDLYTFRNDGAGGWLERQIWPLGSGGTGDVDTLDADGDGDLDAVVTEYLCCGGSVQVHVLENRGDGTFLTPVRLFDPSLTQPERVVTGDFDNDGNPDILTGSGGMLQFWGGNGDGTFRNFAFLSGLNDGGTKFMVSDDFDGDGNLDFAGTTWGSTFQGENMTVALGRGDGTFRPPQIYYSLFSLQFGGVGGIDALDADQDGNRDIVAGSYGANDVALFLNRGDGTFLPEERYGVSGEVTDVRAGDLDGDGIEDLAVNSGGSGVGDGVDIVLGLGAPPFRNLGGAVAGTHGFPRLAGTGTVTGGGSVSIDLTNALENTGGIWIVGLTAVNLPLLGGLLVPAPTVVLPLSTDAAGAASLPLVWPAGLPPGAQLVFQTWLTDPGAAQGLAASNGLAAVQP